MNTNKPLMVAGLIAAMSMGSIGIANASPKSSHLMAGSNKGHNVSASTPSVTAVDPDIAVLAKLVTAGTITQAQSTIILAALQAAHAARPAIGGGEGAEGPHGLGGLGGVNINQEITVITTTLGITAAQLQTDFAAGQSLATIAGVKTPALITALVAAETTKINARVTAGTLTAAQATTLIAGLTAAVTTAVNANPPKFGMGHGGPIGINQGQELTVITTTLGITAAQLQTSLAAGQSLATIAGTKTPALITALVAAETTEINARVTAGTLTAAQATTAIAGLTASVTAAVNATPHKGGMGHGMPGGLGSLGGLITPPTITTSN